MTIKKVDTKILTGFIRNILIGNLEMTEKSQVNETLRTQSIIHINHIIFHGNMQSGKATRIHVTIEGSIACREHIGIDTLPLDKSAGGIRRKYQLTCDFCQKAFNSHRRSQ